VATSSTTTAVATASTAAAAIEAADAQSESLLRCRAHTLHYNQRAVALGDAALAAAALPPNFGVRLSAALLPPPPSKQPTLNRRAALSAALPHSTRIRRWSFSGTSPRQDLKIRPTRTEMIPGLYPGIISGTSFQISLPARMEA